MNRRSLLGAAAALGTAGCLGIVGGEGDGGGEEQKPLLVRAMRARGNETDVECDLSREFVAQFPALQESLRKAEDRPVHEWATTGVSEDRAHEVADAIAARCNPTGGIYHYRDEEFFVSVTPRGTSTVGLDHGHDHSGHDHTHTTDGG